ncbi:MAG: hypothetical protein A2Y10_13675 [Planctomycetes bacterium GWF2_41_51]|nr:MAG: hypothetical protein A2Y10_13675 [Planctomycetes bacterium GWF2_41_51]
MEKEIITRLHKDFEKSVYKQPVRDLQKLLDYDEWRFFLKVIDKAKDFANEITNFSIKRDDLRSESGITKEQVKNNQEVRKLLIKRNIRPEMLPPANDIKKVERKLFSEQKLIKAQLLDTTETAT